MEGLSLEQGELMSKAKYKKVVNLFVAKLEIQWEEWWEDSGEGGRTVGF